MLGAGLEIVGFRLLIDAIRATSMGLLFGGLTAVVAGFAFLMPSLNGLVSRRAPPDDQGQILGVAQSVNSLARIVGSAIGIPLLKRQTHLPFSVAAILMVAGIGMIAWAVRRGHDYGTKP
jgi:DHA1 family tetracycline resistance protein-like MFS transporter